MAGLVKNLLLGSSYSSHLHEFVREEYVCIVDEVVTEEKREHED